MVLKIISFRWTGEVFLEHAFWLSVVLRLGENGCLVLKCNRITFEGSRPCRISVDFLHTACMLGRILTAYNKTPQKKNEKS